MSPNVSDRPFHLWPHGTFCLVCGTVVLPGSTEFRGLAVQERPDWTEQELGGNHVVPDTQVEETDFANHSIQWAHFFRSIIEDPETKTLSVTGIGFNDRAWPLIVPAERGLAWIASERESPPGRTRRSATVLSIRAPPGVPYATHRRNFDCAYPIHAHCWALMGRVVPLQLVDHNLRAFVGAMCEYWEAHMGTWNVAMSHEMGRPCIYRWRQSSVKLADVRTRYRRRVEHHLSDSPLRPPKLQAILEQVAGWGRKAEEQIVKPTLRKPHLPLEVQIMIIDELYKVPHFNRNRVRDVRNLLRAFQWTLPDQYWISRCNLDLGFDIMGIPNMENVTDWGDFCTTLQYKLPGSTWWCTSGLALREAVLYRLKVVKEGFLKRVEGTNEDLDQQL